MNEKETLKTLAQKFPFAGYTSNGSGAYLNILRTVQKHLPKGSKILDFGSGPCDKTAVLQMNGYACSAYDDLSDDWHLIADNRDRIIQFADSVGIDFHLAAGGSLPFTKESFDMVMLHDVLEHLHDSPSGLLNDLLELVRPGGYLFVSVPSAVQIKKRVNVLLGKTNLPPFEQYYWYPGRWRGHVREYVHGDLVKLSEYLGLDVIELRTCDHMLYAVPKPLLVPYIVLTSIFPGWKDSWQLVAKKQAGWAARRALTDSEFRAILGRGTPYHYG